MSEKSGSTKAKRQLLGSADIQRGLQEIADIAKHEGVRVVLVGGVAMFFYGSERLTADLDVAARVPPPAGLKSEGILSFGGSKTRTAGGIPVDWIVRDDDFAAVFEEALQFGRRLHDVPIPVASPEYLAAMKMIAGRDKDDLDLITLLQSGEVDVPKARRMIKRLLGAYAALDFDSKVMKAEWRLTRQGGGLK